MLKDKISLPLNERDRNDTPVKASLRHYTRFTERRKNRRKAGLTSSSFLIEYDNTQNNANHIRSVWRDLRDDWGEDLLVALFCGYLKKGAVMLKVDRMTELCAN